MLQPPRGEFYLEIVPGDTEKIGLPAKSGAPEKAFYGRSYYPSVADIAQAIPIVLVPGEDRFLEIRLPRQKPQTVSVEIAENDAHPVARIELVLERRTVQLFPSTVATASVNSRDPVELGGLSPADYTLVAWTSDGSAGRIGSVQRFSTISRDASILKLDLAQTVTLRGVVRVDPASGSMPTPSGTSISAKMDWCTTETLPPSKSKAVKSSKLSGFSLGNTICTQPRLRGGSYQAWRTELPTRFTKRSVWIMHTPWSLH